MYLAAFVTNWVASSLLYLDPWSPSDVNRAAVPLGAQEGLPRLFSLWGSRCPWIVASLS